MSANLEVSPGEAIRYFRHLQETGQINANESRLALQRWAQAGGQRAFFVRQGMKWSISNEAILCDCGKDLYCPLVKTTFARPRRQEVAS